MIDKEQLPEFMKDLFIKDLLDFEDWQIPSCVPCWVQELAERMINAGWSKEADE